MTLSEQRDYLNRLRLWSLLPVFVGSIGSIIFALLLAERADSSSVDSAADFFQWGTFASALFCITASALHQSLSSRPQGGVYRALTLGQIAPEPGFSVAALNKGIMCMGILVLILAVVLGVPSRANDESLKKVTIKSFLSAFAAINAVLLAVRVKEEGGAGVLARRACATLATVPTRVSELFCPRRAATQAAATGRFEALTSDVLNGDAAAAATGRYQSV